MENLGMKAIFKPLKMLKYEKGEDETELRRLP